MLFFKINLINQYLDLILSTFKRKWQPKSNRCQFCTLSCWFMLLGRCVINQLSFSIRWWKTGFWISNTLRFTEDFLFGYTKLA